MTNNPIPVYIPSLPTFKKLEKYIAKIDASHHYSNFGPLEIEVRERFSEYLGLPLANLVTCVNATLGLEGALETNQNSDFWHLPSWTFSATASAVLRTKGKGHFSDVDDDWRVLVKNDSKNLIDVLPFGQAVGPVERYQSLSLKNLVIDAAASFDSLKDVDMPKNIKSCGVISFHATKVMPAGEGGLFFTNSPEWAEKFRAWTTFGMSGTRISEIGGSNAKMSEYHAAVLLASLDSWNSDRSMWLEQRERAKELTSDLGLQFEPNYSSTFATPYWIVSSNDAFKIQKIKSVLGANNIQTRGWWEDGCHTMPAYKNFEMDTLTNTNFIAKHSLGLPFWKGMSDEVWNRIEKTLKEIF